MVLDTLVAQTTREAFSPPMRETFIAPTLLPICCVCGLIRNETGSSPDRERWVTPQTYRQTPWRESGQGRSHAQLLSEMFYEGHGYSEAVPLEELPLLANTRDATPCTGGNHEVRIHPDHLTHPMVPASATTPIGHAG